MKKIVFIPIIFALAGTSFVAYTFLDTFIIPKNVRKVNIDGSSFWESSETSTISVPVDKYYEDLTPAQIAAKFTETKQFVEKEHYSDPNICIDITTNRDEEDTTTYYVADIRIKHLKYFRTALANDTFGENVNERTSDMCKRKKGILAINGDFYGAQEAGYVLRNGEILRDSVSHDNYGQHPRKNPEDLAVYRDGTFEVFNENDVDLQTIADKGAWQVFSFGPGLVVNGEVAVTERQEVETAMGGGRNQRTAIGIIAPLHYCFVVSDGRISESEGMSLYELANIMKDLHCETAYNLDGGGSSTMYLDDGTGNANGLGHLVNKPTQSLGSGGRPTGNTNLGQREVSDIVYIGQE